jgi:CheY-like chemotaxis protein
MNDEAQPVQTRTVLSVVDDLMFRSRISTAAKAVGVRHIVATSPAAAIERARAERPDLILFDLDSSRTQPMDVLQMLAADPALAATPTLGFVSHVHTHLIEQARSLGIGKVMARSAFVMELEHLLRGEPS